MPIMDEFEDPDKDREKAQPVWPGHEGGDIWEDEERALEEIKKKKDKEIADLEAAFNAS